MNIINYFWTFFIVCSFTSYCNAQNLLVVEKIHAHTKSLKFKIGDMIFFKTYNEEKIHGHINKITDSTLTVNYNTYNLCNIQSILTERKLILVLTEIGIKGGFAFIGIDTFNNLISNEEHTFKAGALKTGGVIIGTGLLLYPFIYKKHLINSEKWKIKVLHYYN